MLHFKEKNYIQTFDFDTNLIKIDEELRKFWTTEYFNMGGISATILNIESSKILKVILTRKAGLFATKVKKKFSSLFPGVFFEMYASKTKLGESPLFDTAKKHDTELVMSIPPIPLCGDVCVEFFHKPYKLKKKVMQTCRCVKTIKWSLKRFWHFSNKRQGNQIVVCM